MNEEEYFEKAEAFEENWVNGNKEKAYEIFMGMSHYEVMRLSLYWLDNNNACSFLFYLEDRLFYS